MHVSVTVLAAALALFCDIPARVINYPYEVSIAAHIATVMGVIGSGIFLYLLLGSRRYAR